MSVQSPLDLIDGGFVFVLKTCSSVLLLYNYRTRPLALLGAESIWRSHKDIDLGVSLLCPLECSWPGA